MTCISQSVKIYLGPPSLSMAMDSKIEVRPGRMINLLTYPMPASDTTVFFFHGLGGRAEQWHEQIGLLKGKYTLIIPDLLGHGKSEKPIASNNPYSFSDFDQDIHALFNRYATRKNIVIGHSYGGALAASLAIDNQTAIKQLILLSPLPCAPNSKVPFIYYLPLFILEYLRPILEKQFLRLAFDKTTPLSLKKEEAEASRSNSMYLIKSMVRGIKKIPRLEVRQLSMPTCVMLGEHDQIIPPIVSKQFYANIPTVQWVMIHQASHMAMLEQPEQFNKVMMEFIHR